MAATQFEHAGQARLALRTIVAEHGAEALSQPGVLANLLSDLLPESPRIARIFVAAAQDNVAEEIRQYTADGMDGETASRLAASTFAAATMFTPDACAWVAGEFALALGLTEEQETGGISTGPSAVPDDPDDTERVRRSSRPAGKARLDVAALSTLPDPQPALSVPDLPRSEPSAAEWIAVVTADREYFDEVVAEGDLEVASIQFPAGYPERRFPLSGPEIQIGRRSVSRGLDPDIDLSQPPADPGVSHLHVVLVAQDDGTWTVVDPGSANGTRVNGDEIPVGVPVRLNDGDRISLGAWTVLTIHATPPAAC